MLDYRIISMYTWRSKKFSVLNNKIVNRRNLLQYYNIYKVDRQDRGTVYYSTEVIMERWISFHSCRDELFINGNLKVICPQSHFSETKSFCISMVKQ